MDGDRTDDVDVREADAEQLGSVARRRHELWPEWVPAALEASRIPPLEHATFVARAGGALHGFATVALRHEANGCRTSPVAFLEDWWVEPDSRRRGIGGRLVEAVREWAADRGCTELASDVALDDDVARQAHRAMGFAEALRVACMVAPLEPAPSEPMRRGVPAGVRIQPITSDDVPGFRDCIDAVARERRWIMMVEGPAIESVRSFVEANIAAGHAQLVALAGPQVVGWCDVLPKRVEGYRHCGTLGMGLQPRWRGRGVGGALLDRTLEAAWATGLRRVELEVYASNTAGRRLYRSRGFVVEGVKRGARIIDGRTDDNVVMALDAP